ncbi:hypothetical protein [Ruegeria arenilitoris]|uniref:hypothetical protein n=1 Tax=Ruegeria arenilitoris TaxID=1173585 RepID=UPI00147E6469|nr:hypothetical protein [Ruegeria arenilitoris]
MGKRSDFDRIPRDKYMTPKKAIDPLLFWIEEGWSFAEPCAGDGGLVRDMIFPCFGPIWKDQAPRCVAV